MTQRRNARIKSYLGLTFPDFVEYLEESAKIYFPKYSKDLSVNSSAKMMLEQAAFVGDILSFYIEDRFVNSNLATAKDVKAVIEHSNFLGYKFNGPTAASGEQSFYLEVPAMTGSDGKVMPDMSYAIRLKNVQLQNNNGIIFEALEDVDFTAVNASSSVDVRISRRDSAGTPTHFILRTKADVVAGKTVTETVSVGDFKANLRVELSEKNILDIQSIVDSDGENWYEVDFLAQEAIFEAVVNTGADSVDVPYVLKLKAVPRRFVRTVNPLNGKTTLSFGRGKAVEIGTSFVPKPEDIALDLKGKLTFSPPAIDPQNFLKSRTTGLAPYNTTLTVRARVGGGSVTNTAVRGLTNIVSKEVEFNGSNLDSRKLNDVLTSISTENEKPLSGGEEAETIEDVQLNASAFFASQYRVNTKEDFIARVLSLPSKFGKVFRVYATTNCEENGGVQLYVVAKNDLGQLSTPTTTLKKNIKNYLRKFTRMGQGIDLMDGKIINVGVEYTIVVAPGHNKTKVKIDTLQKVREYFDIDNWQMNQPIILDEIRCLIMDTEGVVSVSELKIVNKNNVMDGESYSDEIYAIDASTRNGIIFCRPDSIFEVKFPRGKDIKVGAL